MTGPWSVHTKGEPFSRSFEICVIHESDKHGQRSFGWYSKTKIYISDSGGPCHSSVSKFVWDKLVQVAQSVADHMNQGGAA